MNYQKNNINDLFNYFFRYVNDIIYDIHINDIINKELFKCNYFLLNNQSEANYPLTFCLGGGGYILYKNIFENENIKYDIDLTTYDYDISFCFNNYMNKNKLENIGNKIKFISKSSIDNFIFMNLTKDIFIYDFTITNDRLHFRINCDTKLNKPFHILELSFWLNGKISDNFTKNDFKTTKLILYETNKLYYYLLPLKLLVKTTLYAIVDFFENRNFYKCIKYLNRIKYIKKINDLYIKSNINSYILSIILESYNKMIKRKYKMIHDYPFTLSYEFVKIKNNGIIKCIYKHLRSANKNEIISTFEKYKKLCSKEKPYNNNESEITLVDT
jgi:hypothetical protein